MAAPGDPLIVHSFAVELGGMQVEYVQEISGLGYELDVIEVMSINTATNEVVIRKIPGSRKSGEVTITRGLDTSETFTKWINATFLKGAIDEARQNISIIINDSQRQEGRRFEMKNAWVSKWEGPNLKAGEAQHATEKVTVTYEDIITS